MPPVLLGLIWAAMFAVPVSLLSRVRPRVRPRGKAASRPPPSPGAHSRSGRPAKFVRAQSWKGVAWLLAANLVLLYIIDGLAFYHGRPMMTFGGLVPLILVNLVLMVITAAVSTRGLHPRTAQYGQRRSRVGGRDLRHRLARRP